METKKIDSGKVAEAILDKGKSALQYGKERAEIARLLQRQIELEALVEGYLEKNIKLEELYLLGGEMVSNSLQIQYFCARISGGEERNG